MRDSRRFHFWLPADLELLLGTFARDHGLSLGPAIRLALARSLREEESGSRTDESAVSLAALTAAEHTVLMVASVLPEGRRLMEKLAAEAAAAAEARLAMFREDDR